MSNVKGTLLKLKPKLEEAQLLKQQPSDNPKALEEYYQKEILPYLLVLRASNRRDKDEIEAKNLRKKEFYQRLINLEQQCECLEFEAACLMSDVDTTRGQGSGDFGSTFTNGSDLDHSARMQSLDVELARRIELQKKLAELNQETREIELSCSRRAEQLNQVKPYIKQLLEKVGTK